MAGRRWVDAEEEAKTMHSPFFWRNVGLLLLVAAHFVFAVKVLLWLKGRSDFTGDFTRRPTGWGPARRAFSLLYVTASFIILLIAGLLFYEYEGSAEARESWKNSRQWAQVKIGATPPDVVRLLGPPRRSGKDWTPYFIDEDTDDVFIFQIDLIQMDGGMIEFQIDPTSPSKELRVSSKYPSDEIMLRCLTEWGPPEYTYRLLRRGASDSALLISFGGLILLALASLMPFGLRHGWNSWTLYTPFLALMLGTIYEMNVGAGWRFDYFLLVPLYAVVLGCWLFRLVKAVRRTRMADVDGQTHSEVR
jgi:hypothetical protein